MDTRSVIVAVASPPGHSPRGLVRLSGAGCMQLVRKVANVVGLRPDGALPRGVHVARLHAPAPDCPCLLIAMPGPGSSTGEDCAEIHAAGSPYLLENIVAALVGASDGGARRAGPGEFSARAVLNGRLSLLEAERVAWAVAAATDAQLAAADALQGASAGLATGDAADRVANLLALVEAGIDFTDQEDVSAIAPARLARDADAVAERLAALVAADAGAERAMVAPVVALAGPPNAGKSSLFNALLGRTRAVAAPDAGTTRDVLREPLELSNGAAVILVDAPGLEEARSGLDVLMQEQAEAALEHADVVLWCTPVGSPGVAPPKLRAHLVHVATMCDAPARPQAHLDTRAHAHAHAQARVGPQTSAITGAGLPELRAAIAAAVSTRPTLGAAERMTLGMLQRELVAQAVVALRDAVSTARTAPKESRVIPSAELVAASLRTALDRLGEVAGAIPPDDVLGRLFSRFCVGK